MSGPRHVWVDGSIRPADEPHITVFDRGFQLGDGVFETLRARGGHVTELAEHVARLRGSASALGIELPDGLEWRLPAAIAELLAAEGLAGPDGDASLRITVSRGSWESRGLLPPRDVHLTATIAIQAWPVVPPPADHLERGLSLVVSSVRRDPANPVVTLKTTSRADYVYARLEARRAGAEDAVFLTMSGHLSESTTANIFLIRRAARRRGGARDTGPRMRDPPGHDPLLAAALGRQRGPAAVRRLAHARRAGRRRPRRSCRRRWRGSCRSRASTATRSATANRARGRSAPGWIATPSSAATDRQRRVPAEPARWPGLGVPPVSSGRRSPRRHPSTSFARRRSRVSGRFALMTQWVAIRR